MDKKRVIYLSAGAVVLIGVITLLLVLFSGDKQILEYCQTDADCAKVQTSCCPCEMGGEERCVLKKDAETYSFNLTQNCKDRTICAAVYNCNAEACLCVEGECTR